jgi:hypothetical protein
VDATALIVCLKYYLPRCSAAEDESVECTSSSKIDTTYLLDVKHFAVVTPCMQLFASCPKEEEILFAEDRNIR